jgi:small subunit ribosomal protein S6
MDSEVKHYEIAYLINPNIPEDEVFGVAGRITAAIQDSLGVVGRIEEPKRRALAYPIRKLKDAYFGWTTFTSVPASVADIAKRLKQEPSIIRHLISEEVKRPTMPLRPPRPRVRRETSTPLSEVRPFTPAAPKEEDPTKIEELDKRLEEILGK